MTWSLAARSGWLGFALAGLFFYPLASVLDGDPYYLQWQPTHGWFALAALALLTIVFGAALSATLPRGGRLATLMVGGIALIPLLSLGAGVSRQVPFAAALPGLWDRSFVRYGVVAGVVGIVTVVFVLRPRLFRRRLEQALFVLSPIALVVTVALVRSLFQPATPIATRTTPSTNGPSHCRSVLALLFDEFSFAYLYDGAAIRADFPRLRGFGEAATHYVAVRSPGGDTMHAVPAFLAGHAFETVAPSRTALYTVSDGDYQVVDVTTPEGLLPTARRAGLSPEVIGYYFAYCSLVKSAADACRSFSFYNHATTRPSVSGASALVDPILTTVVLWPRQFPLGILKGWAFGRHQRDIVEATVRELAHPIEPGVATFRFVHFSVPHLPFVFTDRGFNPPRDPLEQQPDSAYVHQLRYVDRLFGEILDRMQRDGTFDATTVVFFADHGFRGGGKETDVRHVPFLVKRAGQHERRDITGPVAGEQLLHDVVASACRQD